MGHKKKEIIKEVQTIADTIDLETLNIQLEGKVDGFSLTKKTLANIAQWALDGKTQTEIANNLELSPYEWEYLKKVCPTILLVMQHSWAYADIVVAGTLFQTAVGGKVIKKKVPMKVKIYDNGRCVGEEYQMIEVEEVTEPNPLLLKYLAENKLSEQLGDKPKSTNKEFHELVASFSEEELQAVKSAKKYEN